MRQAPGKWDWGTQGVLRVQNGSQGQGEIASQGR